MKPTNKQAQHVAMEVLHSLPPPHAALPIIADLLLNDDVVDYIYFRAVCREWRSCSASPWGLDSRFRPRRWIMLPDGDANLYTGTNRQFLNLSTGRFLLLCLPELDSHYVHSDSDGLLVLIDKVTHLIRLFNPFTRHLVDLLPLPTKILDDEFRNVGDRLGVPGMIEGFSSSISSGSCPTVGLFSHHFKVVCFAKPGDSIWRFFTFQYTVESMLFFKDRFYFADREKGIQYVDLGKKSFTTLIPLLPPDFGSGFLDQYYLAEYNTELLMVYKSHDGCLELKDGIVRVFRVDLDSNSLVSFSKARDFSIFLGFSSRCLVLSPKSLPSIKGNLTYFCTRLLGNPIILYDFDDGEPETISVNFALHDYRKRRGPSIRPYTLAHHLTTYCEQLNWYVGLMYHEFPDFPDGWFTRGCQMDNLIQKYSLF